MIERGIAYGAGGDFVVVVLVGQDNYHVAPDCTEVLVSEVVAVAVVFAAHGEEFALVLLEVVDLHGDVVVKWLS